MFSLTSVIIRTEIYPIEIEKQIENIMSLLLANLIILFSNCMSVDWMELWFHYCITIAAKICHAVVDLKLEMK